MNTKNTPVDKRIQSPRVGLMITRGQIEHLGHAAIKSQMLMDNGVNILGLGSVQISKTQDNPLTPEQRRKAHIGVWGQSFKMLFLQDIGATDRTRDWADYVFDRIQKSQMPEPTDFYAGSLHEARWYVEHFAALDGAAHYQRGHFQVWENPNTGKRIHILDRENHLPISASEIRSMIARRDEGWKTHVSQKLWDFYDWEYPPELRNAIALEPDTWPEDGLHPVGTKGIRGDDVFILRDDGKWRKRMPVENQKSLGD